MCLLCCLILIFVLVYVFCLDLWFFFNPLSFQITNLLTLPHASTGQSPALGFIHKPSQNASSVSVFVSVFFHLVFFQSLTSSLNNKAEVLIASQVDCHRALSPFPLLGVLITFWIQWSLSLLLTCLWLKRLCTSTLVSHYGHILFFQEISFGEACI